ncbi:hypothetical protein IAT38_006707 [Cryptococcus sp. DSM 104549]
MFFSDDLLTSKKGSFGIIWLMATLGPRNNKITRKQLAAVDLAKTCDLIAMPPEPMALRLSGALLVGVARVYHQNYDIFHSDVSAFHATLRRSTAVDLNAISTGAGELGGIDLPGGGTSRHDHITLGGVDFDWGAGFFGPDFRDIDWENPLNAGRKRRASSVLSSQATPTPLSQNRSHLGQEDDELNIGSIEDDDELQLGRDIKRKKFSASPALGANIIAHSIERAGHLPSDPSASGLYGLSVPFGEEVDLGLNLDYDEPVGVNDSFSGPSGRQLDLSHDMGDVFGVADDAPMMVFDDDDYPAFPLQETSHPNAAGIAQRPGSCEGSLEDIEEVLEPPKKTKSARKAVFDNEVELDRDGDQKARQEYAQSMNQERTLLQTKDAEKALILQANDLVNSAGGLKFFNTDMAAFISTSFQVEKFKWEVDLAVRRQRQQGIADLQIEDEEGDIQNQRSNGQDVFGPLDGGHAAMTFPEENYLPMVFDEYEPERQGSEALDIEYARHMSVQSQGLPWEAYLTPGFDDAGDTSFSPGSLRLSIMTPQEQRLRLNDRSNPTIGHHQQRVRSSSLISDRPDNDPLLLTAGKDVSLDSNISYVLQVNDDLNTFTSPLSHAARIPILPKAFSPAMLATLEKQCRKFFIYIEKQMVKMHTDQLEFADIVPSKSSRRVAAIAFYDCLTLTTKEILNVNQPQPWGHVHIKFSVSA